MRPSPHTACEPPRSERFRRSTCPGPGAECGPAHGAGAPRRRGAPGVTPTSMRCARLLPNLTPFASEVRKRLAAGRIPSTGTSTPLRHGTHSLHRATLPPGKLARRTAPGQGVGYVECRARRGRIVLTEVGAWPGRAGALARGSAAGVLSATGPGRERRHRAGDHLGAADPTGPQEGSCSGTDPRRPGARGRVVPARSRDPRRQGVRAVRVSAAQALLGLDAGTAAQALAWALERAGLACFDAFGSSSDCLARTPSSTWSPRSLSTLRQ